MGKPQTLILSVFLVAIACKPQKKQGLNALSAWQIEGERVIESNRYLYQLDFSDRFTKKFPINIQQELMTQFCLFFENPIARQAPEIAKDELTLAFFTAGSKCETSDKSSDLIKLPANNQNLPLAAASFSAEHLYLGLEVEKKQLFSFYENLSRIQLNLEKYFVLWFPKLEDTELQYPVPIGLVRQTQKKRFEVFSLCDGIFISLCLGKYENESSTKLSIDLSRNGYLLGLSSWESERLRKQYEQTLGWQSGRIARLLEPAQVSQQKLLDSPK